MAVDDDAPIRRMLVRTLSADGFEAKAAGDGGAALAAIEKSAPDLLVLDVSMPGLGGLEVCRRLRAKGLGFPILLLTARDAVSERVAGLDAGADDYLVKPFAFGELLARLRALIRGRAGERPAVLQAADIVVDPARHLVKRNGSEVELSPREFALLEFLMHHAGEVVTRTEILEHVWDYGYDGVSNVVNVYVGHLRRKLEVPFGRPLIHTVRGVGYVLEQG